MPSNPHSALDLASLGLDDATWPLKLSPERTLSKHGHSENMAVIATLPDYDFDSASPYPSSSPSSESDAELCAFPSSNAALRSSIASIPESKLRSIMVKLARSNPRFQKAITKELAYDSHSKESPPTTPTTPNPKHRKSRHSTTRRNNCKGLSLAMHNPFLHSRKMASLKTLDRDEYVYHPGHLDSELYEFLSRTPEDVSFNVVRTINMWSCCDEDESSPGCVVAPSYAIPEQHQEPFVEFLHPDIFPDSDLERPSEDLINNTVSRSSRAEQL